MVSKSSRMTSKTAKKNPVIAIINVKKHVKLNLRINKKKNCLNDTMMTKKAKENNKKRIVQKNLRKSKKEKKELLSFIQG